MMDPQEGASGRQDRAQVLPVGGAGRDFLSRGIARRLRRGGDYWHAPTRPACVALGVAGETEKLSFDVTVVGLSRLAELLRLRILIDPHLALGAMGEDGSSPKALIWVESLEDRSGFLRAGLAVGTDQ